MEILARSLYFDKDKTKLNGPWADARDPTFVLLVHPSSPNSNLHAKGLHAYDRVRVA